MQTPTGYKIIDGKFHMPTAGSTLSSTPRFPYRLTHKLLASTLTAAFLIAGLSAWQLLRKTANAGTRRALHTGRGGGGHCHPAADPGGRHARAEHAGAPARQDRRH
jgi:cytochrome bd-type quinol oxidase subunit 1